MKTAFRIALDVFSFRIKRFEVGQLLVPFSVIFTYQYSGLAMLKRGGLVTLLFFFIHLNNDVCDLNIDQEENRAPDKTKFLRQNKNIAIWLQWTIGSFTLLFLYFFDVKFLMPVFVGGLAGVMYSAWLKKLPFIDLLTNSVWPAMLILVSSPFFEFVGILLAIQISLFTIVVQPLQLLRDYDNDKKLGLKNTVIWLGIKKTKILIKFLILINSLYGVLFLHKFFGLMFLSLLLIPIKRNRTRSIIMMFRGIFILYWLGVLWYLYFYSQAIGIIVFS